MKALTVQIGIFGKVNSGKSSLMNFITGQKTSIVSSIAGTTTDLVYKQMELNPLGPVTFIDTAGTDDVSGLGKERAERTQKAMDASDIVMLVCQAGIFGAFEKNIISAAEKRNTPVIAVINKTDLKRPRKSFTDRLSSYTENILEVFFGRTFRQGFFS